MALALNRPTDSRTTDEVEIAKAKQQEGNSQHIQMSLFSLFKKYKISASIKALLFSLPFSHSPSKYLCIMIYFLLLLLLLSYLYYDDIMPGKHFFSVTMICNCNSCYSCKTTVKRQ